MTVTIEQLKTRHQEICNCALNLVVKRGKEYASDEDTLQTFNMAGHYLNRKASQITDDLIAVKISRMFNSKDIPYDSVLDCINYLVYKIVLMEQEK